MIVAIVALSVLLLVSGLMNRYLIRRLVALEYSARRDGDKRVAELYQLFLSKGAAEIDRFIFDGEREKERHQYRMTKLKLRGDYAEPVAVDRVDPSVDITGTFG